ASIGSLIRRGGAGQWVGRKMGFATSCAFVVLRTCRRRNCCVAVLSSGDTCRFQTDIGPKGSITDVTCRMSSIVVTPLSRRTFFDRQSGAEGRNMERECAEKQDPGCQSK